MRFDCRSEGRDNCMYYLYICIPVASFVCVTVSWKSVDSCSFCRPEICELSASSTVGQRLVNRFIDDGIGSPIGLYRP
jgi:hypothetical protein